MLTVMCDGREVDINNPRPADFSIDQIAQHLVRIPRYLGATCRHYSVLEHSILGCEFVLDAKPFGAYNRIIARAFLLHDAHEAVIGDFVLPVTAVVPGLKELIEPVKERIDIAIEQAFDVRLRGLPFSDMIATVDKVMLQAEWIDLMPTTWYGPDHMKDIGKAPKGIDKYHPDCLPSQMIGKFHHLMRITA